MFVPGMVKDGLQITPVAVRTWYCMGRTGEHARERTDEPRMLSAGTWLLIYPGYAIHRQSPYIRVSNRTRFGTDVKCGDGFNRDHVVTTAYLLVTYFEYSRSIVGRKISRAQVVINRTRIRC